MKETIVEFPEKRPADLAVIEEEAGAWLIKMDGDDPLTAEERVRLNEWLSRSPVHEEELANQARLWGKLNVLTELSVPLGSAAVKDKDQSPTGRILSLGWTSWPAAAIAAVMTVIMIGAIFLMQPQPYLQSNGLYATAVGQQQTTTLADGSVLTLNTNTQLRVDYGEEFRIVRMLQGEAHFEIAKNADTPFRVYVDEGFIEAIGTAFSIRLESDRADLIVTEGAVAVTPLLGDAPLLDAAPQSLAETERTTYVEEAQNVVTAGQSAAVKRRDSFNAGENTQPLSKIVDVDAREIARKLSWREGYLTFSGEPLGDAVNEISRYTTLSIEIADPTLETIRIGGRFPVDETDGMLNALETNFGLRVTRVGAGRILLSAVE